MRPLLLLVALLCAAAIRAQGGTCSITTSTQCTADTECPSGESCSDFTASVREKSPYTLIFRFVDASRCTAGTAAGQVCDPHFAATDCPGCVGNACCVAAPMTPLAFNMRIDRRDPTHPGAPLTQILDWTAYPTPSSSVVRAAVPGTAAAILDDTLDLEPHLHTFSWTGPGNCSISTTTVCAGDGQCPGGETCNLAVSYDQRTLEVKNAAAVY